MYLELKNLHKRFDKESVVDDLNLYASLDDILVKEGILKDDNRNIIRSRDGSRVHYDKERPRAEIYIYNYEEEEEDGTGN